MYTVSWLNYCCGFHSFCEVIERKLHEMLYQYCSTGTCTSKAPPHPKKCMFGNNKLITMYLAHKLIFSKPDAVGQWYIIFLFHKNGMLEYLFLKVHFLSYYTKNDVLEQIVS